MYVAYFILCLILIHGYGLILNYWFFQAQYSTDNWPATPPYTPCGKEMSKSVAIFMPDSSRPSAHSTSDAASAFPTPEIDYVHFDASPKNTLQRSSKPKSSSFSKVHVHEVQCTCIFCVYALHIEVITYLHV